MLRSLLSTDDLHSDSVSVFVFQDPFLIHSFSSSFIYSCTRCCAGHLLWGSLFPPSWKAAVFPSQGAVTVHRFWWIYLENCREMSAELLGIEPQAFRNSSPYHPTPALNKFILLPNPCSPAPLSNQLLLAFWAAWPWGCGLTAPWKLSTCGQFFLGLSVPPPNISCSWTDTPELSRRTGEGQTKNSSVLGNFKSISWIWLWTFRVIQMVCLWKHPALS